MTPSPIVLASGVFSHQPENAEFDSFLALWGLALLFGLLAFVFVIVGVGLGLGVGLIRV